MYQVKRRTGEDSDGIRMKQRSQNLRLYSALLMGIAIVTFAIAYSWPRSQNSSSVMEDSDDFERMRPNLKVATILNADTAWLINTKSGDLVRTDDGGQHWLTTSAESVGGRFFTAYFNNERQGWAVGSGGTVWHSSDSGGSWTRISKLDEGDPSRWSFISAGQIQFINHATGWIVETFGVWRSEDGGKSWRRVRGVDGRDGGQPVAGVFAEKTAAIGFSNGDVHYTFDGARSWNSIQVIDKGDIKHIDGLVGQFSWVVTYGPPSYAFGVLYSEDGGKVWRNSGEIPDNGSIYFLQFLNRAEGWAVGATPARPGQQEPTGLVLHTSDGGKTWKQQTAPHGELLFQAVHFADPKHGWLLGRNSVYRTSDGGSGWSLVFKLD